MTVALLDSAGAELVTATLAPGAIEPAFQPIVELRTGTIVAVEGLARWPHVRGADPASVFAAAETLGLTAQLDWACRTAITRAALDLELNPRAALFINVEAATLGQPMPAAYQHLVARTSGRFRIVLELTERDLMRDPAQLLTLVRWAREQGWGIAMDDVGADVDSLALLPFVAPEVVKLDLSLIQQSQVNDQVRTMLAVAAYAEETGAVLVAEGIETEEHLERALSIGADYGQGWLLGRPGPLEPKQVLGELPKWLGADLDDETPFDLVRSSRQLRRGRKRLLLDITRALERQAMASEEAAVVLSAFQYRENFTVATARRYQRMARQLPLVAALGTGLSCASAPGVRVIDLNADDPLTGEWTVVVVGPHYAGALIARDCGEDVPDLDRTFDFLLTQDRDTVLRAGRALMRRITAEPRTRP